MFKNNFPITVYSYSRNLTCGKKKKTSVLYTERIFPETALANLDRSSKKFPQTFVFTACFSRRTSNESDRSFGTEINYYTATIILSKLIISLVERDVFRSVVDLRGPSVGLYPNEFLSQSDYFQKSHLPQ